MSYPATCPECRTDLDHKSREPREPDAVHGVFCSGCGYTMDFHDVAATESGDTGESDRSGADDSPLPA